MSIELKSWRIKRITYTELESHFNRLMEAEAEPRQKDDRLPQGIRRWQSFVEMNALDVLQQLDCVPWSIATPLNYQAQLMIDVGADRRYVALSLLICRGEQYKPAFWLDTISWQKSDPKCETINEVILQDRIVALFKRAERKGFDPTESLLGLRDGRECGRELEGIQATRKELIHLGLLSKDAPVDVVNLHKRSLKEIRVWERNADDVANVLEGMALFPNQRIVVLANTGAATLHQGTANPLVLEATENGIDMLAVATDVFTTAQLNWSNPRVAQRLPLPSKRTDDELRNRAAQEIRRIR